MLNVESFQNILYLMMVLVFFEDFGLNLPHDLTSQLFVPFLFDAVDKELLILRKLGLFKVLVETSEYFKLELLNLRADLGEDLLDLLLNGLRVVLEQDGG